jgi:hypothetical protein
MRGHDQEVRVVCANLGVLGERERHSVGAAVAAALADELHRRGLIAIAKLVLQPLDRLVHLAVEVFVPRGSRFSGGHRKSISLLSGLHKLSPRLTYLRGRENGCVPDDQTRITGVAENEAAFRAANEKLRIVFEDADQDELPFLCECGDFKCTQVVPVALDTYERVREEPVRFLVSPGHKQLDQETVVEAGEGYEIIEKSGLAGEIARTRWLTPHGRRDTGS